MGSNSLKGRRWGLPVAALAAAPMVLVVHPSVAANSVRELVAQAKAAPGKLNYSNPGNGTPQHLAAALFSIMAGADITHIVYKGAGPATAGPENLRPNGRDQQQSEEGGDGGGGGNGVNKAVSLALLAFVLLSAYPPSTNIRSRDSDSSSNQCYFSSSLCYSSGD